MNIKKILHFFTDTIFRLDLREWHNPVARWFVRQYRLWFYTARGLVGHGTMIRSAALTYYTLMSLVPIIAVVFAIVKGFGLADRLIDNLYGLFPQNPEIIDYVVGFAERALARTQGGIVAAVALLTLFWAVIKVFSSIENAFNNIWEVKSERSIARQYTDYIAVVLIVPILWIVANAVGNYAQELFGEEGRWYYMILLRLASLLVFWVMFTLLYLIIPNAKVRFGSALMAGIVAGSFFSFPVGLCLSAAMDDLLQRHLRQFRRAAAVAHLVADIMADLPVRRRAVVRLSEYRPFRRRTRIAARQLTTSGARSCWPRWSSSSGISATKAAPIRRMLSAIGSGCPHAS